MRPSLNWSLISFSFFPNWSRSPAEISTTLTYIVHLCHWEASACWVSQTQSLHFPSFHCLTMSQISLSVRVNSAHPLRHLSFFTLEEPFGISSWCVSVVRCRSFRLSCVSKGQQPTYLEGSPGLTCRRKRPAMNNKQQLADAKEESNIVD